MLDSRLCSACSSARPTNLRGRRREDPSRRCSPSRSGTARSCSASAPLQSSAEQRLTRAGSAPLPAALDGEPRIAGSDPNAHRPRRLGERGGGRAPTAATPSPAPKTARSEFWDLQTGQLLRTFTGHEAGVKAWRSAPTAPRALGSGDRTLKLWDLETGQLLRTLTGHEDGVSAVAMTPDGRHALSGSRDRTLRLWDLATGQLLRTLAGHEDGVSAVAMSPDGRHALSGSRDGTLKLWDLATGQLLHTLTGHEGMVYAVAVSPDGRHALSGSDDRTVKFWDLADRRAPPHLRRSRGRSERGGGEPRRRQPSRARTTARSGSGTWKQASSSAPSRATKMG